MFRVVAVLALALCAVARPARAEPKHDVTIEALGKGGLWGVGYDYHFHHRFAVGAVGSYYQLSGDRYLTFSPYLMAYPVRGQHFAWFAQLGPQLIHHTTPSPVPEWQGMSTTTFAGQLSSGVEFRDHIIVRLYGMISVGEHTVPWVGASIGWSL